MLIVSGTALVLLTWLLAVALPITLGLLPALAVSRFDVPCTRSLVMRRSLWWGLALVGLTVTLINLFVPLGSAEAAWILLGLVLVLGIPGWILLHHTCRMSIPARDGPARALLWCALIVSIVYLAVAALGPATNYDTGLYHLGAVRYAAEFATIPGLANLYFPFGYASVEFPLAAVLGNGPWQQDGFRLLNGLIMTMAAADLWWRSRARMRGPGFYVLGVGILCSWIPLVALSDFWVTSPTQDASVFVLTIVATGYLTQAVAGGPHWRAEGATAAVLGIMMVLIRPTMIVWSALAVIVFVTLLVGRRSGFMPPAMVVVFGAASAVVIAARDRGLSGWLQYPLTLYAFDVPWRAVDPYLDRAATLGYHRDPGDLWAAVDGWGWLVAWLRDRVQMWETYMLVGLVIAGVVALWLSRAHGRARLRGRQLVVAMIPSILGTGFWLLFTPPSYRFAWGVVFSLGTIPLGWALWRLAESYPARYRRLTAVGVALPILLVTCFSAGARLDVGSIGEGREWRLASITIPYAVAPLPEPPVTPFVTESGLALKQPIDSDQCWTSYPLCTPRPPATLRMRGSEIGDGFLP
jgi:hypothetical protein